MSRHTISALTAPHHLIMGFCDLSSAELMNKMKHDMARDFEMIAVLMLGSGSIPEITSMFGLVRCHSATFLK